MMQRKKILSMWLGPLIIGLVAITAGIFTGANPARVNASEALLVEAQGAWVQLAPPGAPVNAAYMRLKNNSSINRVIVSAQSDCCRKVMMHESRRSGDTATMVQRDSLELPAHSELVLAPGGLHLMLLGAHQPIAENDTLNMQLMFADGETLSVQAQVKKVLGHNHEHHH